MTGRGPSGSRGTQIYRHQDLTIEGDWSNAAFWFAAAGMGCELDIQGLNPLSCQGDMRIAAHYAALRGRSWSGRQGRRPPPGRAGQTVELDMSQCPDLVPPVAALAALTPGCDTHLVNAARLRIKESDRLATVTEVLNALGAQVEEYPDSLLIHGRASLAGGVAVSGHNDHRIAMMAAIAAIRCEAPVTVAGLSV